MLEGIRSLNEQIKSMLEAVRSFQEEQTLSQAEVDSLMKSKPRPKIKPKLLPKRPDQPIS
jgi:response regulator of citrate/malate metabolism